MKKEHRNLLIIGIVVIVSIILIALPLVLKDILSLNQSKLEYNLILEGKTVSARQITENFLDDLKNRNYESLKKYISNDCQFYDSSTKVYSIDSLLNKLDEYSTSRIEERSSSIKDEESYRIYWNSQTLSDGGQKIDIILHREITKELVTYKIKSIIISSNM